MASCVYVFLFVVCSAVQLVRCMCNTPVTFRHAAAHPSIVVGEKLGSGLAQGMSPPPQFWWLQVNSADDPKASIITMEADAIL